MFLVKASNEHKRLVGIGGEMVIENLDEPGEADVLLAVSDENQRPCSLELFEVVVHDQQSNSAELAGELAA
jgi:hypothetical protein